MKEKWNEKWQKSGYCELQVRKVDGSETDYRCSAHQVAASPCTTLLFHPIPLSRACYVFSRATSPFNSNLEYLKLPMSATCTEISYDWEVSCIIQVLTWNYGKAGHESGSSAGTHEYTRGNTRGWRDPRIRITRRHGSLRIWVWILWWRVPVAGTRCSPAVISNKAKLASFLNTSTINRLWGSISVGVYSAEFEFNINWVPSTFFTRVVGEIRPVTFAPLPSPEGCGPGSGWNWI